jgi:hypothetical protein
LEYPHKQISRVLTSGERVGHETEAQVREKSSVQDNFLAAIDALHDCNVMELHRVEITPEDAL